MRTVASSPMFRYCFVLETPSVTAANSFVAPESAVRRHLALQSKYLPRPPLLLLALPSLEPASLGWHLLGQQPPPPSRLLPLLAHAALEKPRRLFLPTPFPLHEGSLRPSPPLRLSHLQSYPLGTDCAEGCAEGALEPCPQAPTSGRLIPTLPHPQSVLRLARCLAWQTKAVLHDHPRHIAQPRLGDDIREARTTREAQRTAGNLFPQLI